MKKIIQLFIASTIMIVLYYILSIYFYDRIVPIEIENNRETVWTVDLLNDVSKDFVLKEYGVFCSTSPDPWFTVETDYPVKTIIIDVKYISEKGNAQIFYYSPETGIDSSNSYFKVLSKGKNYFQIPKGNYNCFRLDLTENENVDIELDKVTLYGSRVYETGFWVLYFVLVIIIVKCTFCIFYWDCDKWKKFADKIAKEGEYRFYRKLLLCIIAFTAAIVYGKLAVSGHEYVYYDIGGGDGPEAYFPVFVSYIEKIRTGGFSSWTFNNGLGTSTTAFWGFILNPFLFPMFIAGVIFGISTINEMVLVGQILNIFVCGLLCYKYLKNFRGSCMAKAIASYICAFSGYVILYAQHYVHSQFLFYLLVVLIIIENIINSEQYQYYFYLSAVCSVLFISSVYLGYMIGIFAGIYTIIRMLQKYSESNRKKLLKKFGALIVFASAGILIAFPVVIPTVNELLNNSDRIAGNGISLMDKFRDFLLNPYPLEAFRTIILRLLSNNLEGAGNDFFGATGNYSSDYYTAPELFFSVFFLIFALVYLAQIIMKKSGKREKLLKLIVYFLAAFMMFNRLGSAVFNAFVATFGRYTYLLVPVFSLMAVSVIDGIRDMKIQHQSVWFLGIGLTIFILAAQYGILAVSGHRYKYLYDLIKIDLLLLVCTFVLLFMYKKIELHKWYVMFGVLIAVNIVCDSYITVNRRAFCSFSEDLTDQDDYGTQDALKYVEDIEDNGMYRLEKNYYDLIYFHDAYFQNYCGISTYNSTLNKNVKAFYDWFCNPAINFYGKNSFWYSYMNISNDVLQSSLLGIKYIFSRQGEYHNGVYSLIYDNSEVKVYQNNAVNGFGIFYKDIIPKSEVEALSYIERLKVLSAAMVVEDEYASSAEGVITYAELSEEEDWTDIIHYEELNCVADSDMATMEIDLEKTSRQKEKGKWYLEFSTDMGYADNCMIYFDCGEGFGKIVPYYYRGNDACCQEACVILPEKIQKIKFVFSKRSVTIKNLKILTSKREIVPKIASAKFAKIKDSLLQGNIKNDVEGYLFIPIPFEQGWSAFVDGKETEIIQADLGFMALQIDAGDHEIIMRYHYPGLKEGIIGAVIGLLALTVLFKIYKRKNLLTQAV